MFNAAELCALRGHTKTVENEAKDLELMVSELSGRVEALQRENAPGYVASGGGNDPIQIVANSSRMCLPEVWVTKCGWRCGHSRHGLLAAICETLSVHRLCGRCLLEAWASRPEPDAPAPPYVIVSSLFSPTSVVIDLGSNSRSTYHADQPSQLVHSKKQIGWVGG